MKSLISILEAHSHEVCGLKFSPDERFLTSGGSDALANVWESTQISTNNAVEQLLFFLICFLFCIFEETSLYIQRSFVNSKGHRICKKRIVKNIQMFIFKNFFKVPTMGLGPSNLVATGGGTRDHSIRIWNLSDGGVYFTLDTQSQVMDAKQYSNQSKLMFFFERSPEFFSTKHMAK